MLSKYMDNSKVARKKVAQFICNDCDYFTSKTSSWKKHLQTVKHQRITRITKKLLAHDQTNNVKEFICFCGKKYKYCSGLSKHKKKCKSANISKNAEKSNNSVQTIKIKKSMKIYKIFKNVLQKSKVFLKMNKKLINERIFTGNLQKMNKKLRNFYINREFS